MEPRQSGAPYLRRIGDFIELIRRAVLVRFNSEIIRAKLLYVPYMRRRGKIIPTKIVGYFNNIRLPRISRPRWSATTVGTSKGPEMTQEQDMGLLIEEPSSRFRRVFTWAIGITVLAAAGSAVYFVFFVDGEEDNIEATVEKVTVERGELTTTLTTSGTAAAGVSSQLTFATGGQVVAVEAGIGDQVMEGQVVARLDETDAQRRLQTAETNLEQAKLRLRQIEEPPADEETAAARQATAAARSQIVSSELSLERLQSPPAEADIAAADAAIAQAESTLERLKTPPTNAEIAAADAAVAQAESALERLKTPPPPPRAPTSPRPTPP